MISNEFILLPVKEVDFFMKTLEEVFSLENLYKTHKRCRCCKQHKREVIQFELRLGQNLIKIRNEILNHTYTIKHYRKMKIFEPKERLIDWLPYKHRIVQNCFCEYLLKPVFEKKLIYDNCACRINKGTDFARKRLKLFLNKIKKNNKEIYCLKCDIKKFFPLINRNVLRQKLEKIFPNDIMWLLNVYLNTISSEKGIPIGNQTSQWFALLYLNDIDHKIKENYKIKYYIRYMDDILILHNNKNFLKEKLKLLIKDVSKHDISFNNKTQIYNSTQGIPFLGFVYKIKQQKIITNTNKNSYNRIKRSMKRNLFLYCNNLRNFQEYCSVLLNYRHYFKYNNIKFS